jgi:hypothetical protein
MNRNSSRVELGEKRSSTIQGIENQIMRIEEDPNSFFDRAQAYCLESDFSKTKNRKRPKILTCVFDYESYATNPLNFKEKKVVFRVLKGDNVKLIRDYDENFYLVSQLSTGQIGFVPKEFMIDMKELKQNLRMQELREKHLTSSSDLSSSDYSCYSQPKLTQL